MIEKMKFLSITGPKGDIDRVVNTYLCKYEVHLENALSELTEVRNLTPFFEINPYRESLNLVSEYYNRLDNPDKLPSMEISMEEALDFINKLDQQIKSLESKRHETELERAKILESMKIIGHFRELDFNINQLLQFKFVKYRFGKIERPYFDKFEQYVYQNLNTVFYRCGSDDEYVWGVYFAPASQAHQIDAVFSSMHFERIYMPDEYEGTPEEAFQKLKNEYESLSTSSTDNSEQVTKLLADNAAKLKAAKEKIEALSYGFDVRKVAACTQGERDTFYIICGWMSEKDAESFQKDVEGDDKLFVIIEDQNNRVLEQPPTKLKNPKVFKPFEMFIQMYGLPAYGEMDPTWFVSITYAFIFGCMFGDAGQGLCLLIGGLILYKTKHMSLAAIISMCGIFSTLFGVLFGSFFGFEDIIPALWLRPLDSMTDLPFVGKLNTVFVIAIAFGMCIIIACMVFHIINGIRSKDPENSWFDTNALAGLCFYGAIVAVIVLYMTGHTVPGTAVLVIMFGVPLLIIFFKEPLTNLIQKKSKIMPDDKGMFFVQGFFEVFEVLLSYFSNTLSFVRIGAFAVSHAAMMQVVLMLAGAENGSPNWIVIILGNLFVIGMEGLIVGIQVLRLEYYEIFSRFYKGNGRPFVPFKYNNNKK